MDTFVKKPTDWLASGIPLGSGDFDLKQYAEMKVNRLKKGIALGGIGDSSYLKVRDASEDANGNRTGTQTLEFLRTTPTENFGSDQCADWMLSTNATCGLDIYRKATHPTLGTLYDGDVLQCLADGDVKIPKAGGLSVGGVDVATETYVTNITNVLDASVSQLVTSSSNHNQRLITIEDSGYVTQQIQLKNLMSLVAFVRTLRS